ncbi:MAG TPA: transporter [Opitutaceae bacterium]|nr:transporter [Opitutaceae bacterium]
MTTPFVRERWTRLLLWPALLAGACLPLGAQVTETPHTVEPGRFLLEMDAVSLNFDRTGETEYDALGLATTIVSAGLTRNLDIQAGFQLFVRSRFENRNFRDTRSGLGDLTFRTKWTFWRDDQLAAAAAVIPFVKIPSNTGDVGNGSVEGGIIVPWGMTLPGGVVTGAMFRWDVLRNPSDDGYDSRWFASAYAHRSFTRFLGFYGETTVAVSSESASSFAGTIGGGVTLTASKNLFWDYGISRGLGSRGTDWIHVVRLTWGF